ncbi:MAG: hypothetical protein WCD18_20335 [Thermosynechococcaceae cyanobacterium]
MTYEMALKDEQDQRNKQSLIAAESRNSEIWDELDRPIGPYGPGQLCACGVKIAADCDCPF